MKIQIFYYLKLNLLILYYRYIPMFYNHMIVQVPFSWENWFWSRVFVRSVGVKLANMTFVFAFFFDFKAQNLWVEMNILNPGSRDTSQKLTLKQSPFTTSNTERQLSNVRQINLSNENIKNKHWCFQISKLVSPEYYSGISIYILPWKYLLLRRNNKLRINNFLTNIWLDK